MIVLYSRLNKNNKLNINDELSGNLLLYLFNLDSNDRITVMGSSARDYALQALFASLKIVYRTERLPPRS